MEPVSPVFPKVQADSLPSEPPGKPLRMFILACDALGLGGGGGGNHFKICIFSFSDVAG